jgi:ketosteroid isomerase-like protein
MRRRATMKAAELVEQVRQTFETGEVERFGALVAPGAEIRNPFTAVQGPEGFAELARDFTEAFSERRIEVLGVVDSGTTAVAQIRVRARHTGPLKLPDGEVPATGNDIEFEEAGVVRVRDGRIASWHSYYDTLALAHQLGIVTVAAGA